MADREPPSGYVAIGLEAFRIKALANKMLDLAREAEEREVTGEQVDKALLYDVKVQREMLRRKIREFEQRLDMTDGR